MIKLPFYTYPSFDQDVQLDGERYVIKVQWNTREEAWQLSILTSDRTPVLEGIKLVPNYDLLEGMHHLAVPPGALFVLAAEGDTARIAYEDFGNDRALQLVYATEVELATIRT